MTAVTIDQLAQLYQAANQANSDLAAAYRNRDTAMIGMLRDRSRELNRSYAAAKRRRKRQQKSSGRVSISKHAMPQPPLQRQHPRSRNLPRR